MNAPAIAEQFDYVVVGGGSAGSVVAGRLSENPDHRVCLIEAGPDDDDLRIKIPIGLLWLMGNERFDWCYRSAPHAHLDGKRVSVPRGKTLGGSGSINSMVYIRGRPSDYDAWAKEGCSGWDWDAVLPRFVRQERNAELGHDALHGDEGPLFVQDLASPHPFVERYVAAGKALGIPFNEDFNGIAQEGLGNYQATMNNGRRCSPADAFLGPARSRPNVTILTNTEAKRIRFDARRATALNVVTEGAEREIGVRGELVLSAGAIGSPTLLLRSGVGSGACSQALGIPIVLDLPSVGENLHDHPAVGVHYGGGNHGYGLSLATAGQNLLAPFRYLLSRSGVFASNSVEAGGFAKTQRRLSEPDVQFHFIPARVDHEGATFTWGRGYYSDVCLLKPRSRGELRLESGDASADPVIDLNLLSDPKDQDAMLRGAKLLRELLSRPELKTGDAEELVPGPSVVTDDDLGDYIAKRLGTAYHPVGSCRMGNPQDSRAVVDPKLRVIGLENVRIADASIMPEVVAGNTNAPSMMIGDAAVDFLRAAS